METETLHSSEPWYLTIVRTQGILFVRPEKSWRPIVSLTVVDADQDYETTLGCDGQNPNLKSPFVLRNIDHGTRLDIKVWHKSHSKNRKKRHLVGSAYISVGDAVKRQNRPGSDVDLHLSCPPPQKRSPTIGGSRKLNCATLTIRLRAPISTPPSSSVTAVDSPLNSPTASRYEEVFSDDVLSDTPSIQTNTKPPEPTWPDTTQIQVPPNEGPNILRKRRRKPKAKPYCINTSDEENEPLSSAESASCPPSPTQNDFYPTTCLPDGTALPQAFEVIKYLEDEGNITIIGDQEECDTAWVAPRILPLHTDESSVGGSLGIIGSIVDRFAPYRELCEAAQESDFERVLGRLLTEWYVVGASLLAVAGLNAAVFGFSSDTLFAVDGLAKRSIAIGSIAAGIGIVSDAWFLVVYSGANVAKFQRVALDVYNTYFFFCLTCRLPAVCMFISACSLMIFLFTVAWEAWPVAVLVMSFVAGTLVSLQYLVFGFHRMVNMVIWVARALWRGLIRIFGLRRGPASTPAVATNAGMNAGGDVGNEDEVIRMPVPDTSGSAPVGT